MTTVKNIEFALIKFEEAANKHAEATEQVDYKTGNKNYALIAKVMDILKENNELEKFSKYLNHKVSRCSPMGCNILSDYFRKRRITCFKADCFRDRNTFTYCKTTVSEWEKVSLIL